MSFKSAHVGKPLPAEQQGAEAGRSALTAAACCAVAKLPVKPKVPVSRGAADVTEGLWLLGVAHTKERQQRHMCWEEVARGNF